ncbi:MAG: transposase [Deltaproteobacteria bacterium]|nr:transposase [Deltaproteobacteria bacterium]
MARALIVLFLARREQQVLSNDLFAGRCESWLGRQFRRAPAIARNLTTLFGVVRYWRTYMREVADADRHGFHPLDVTLGLTAERFSWNVLARAARLATQLSFADARSVMSDFVPNTPSTEVIERTVLGLGAHTETWFEQQPAPEDDGEVLEIEIDGKGVPTATERELKRRRRKRRAKAEGCSTSPRHRGRAKRSRHGKQPRRRKGDKRKNAKVATMLVMYTLRRKGTRRLEGPVNRRHYASFGSKRHAFAIARREAEKRGFGADSGKLVQVVTDGDNDYADLVAEFFPNAIHTIDCYHVFEKLWEAGGTFLTEGSKELKAWVADQKEKLFRDNVDDVLSEMQRQFDLIPKTGPGNKGRRERLAAARNYLKKRASKISYGYLRRRDLVISTGIVEGAIKYIIGRRCDHGGMRWIKERAQAILQLRCIEANGDWEAFERFVHARLHAMSIVDFASPRLQISIPEPLPNAA